MGLPEGRRRLQTWGLHGSWESAKKNLESGSDAKRALQLESAAQMVAQVSNFSLSIVTQSVIGLLWHASVSTASRGLIKSMFSAKGQCIDLAIRTKDSMKASGPIRLRRR